MLSSEPDTRYRERKSLMLLKMFWYFLLTVLVSLCGSFQPVRLKASQRLRAALKSGQKVFYMHIFYYQCVSLL